MKVGNQISKKEGNNIFEVITSQQEQFAKALPKHINSERFTRIALTTLRQNPALMECSKASLLGSLMVLAQLGLEPGSLGQAYLLPFKNYKAGTTECQLQISYKGLIELLRRTGQLRDIYAYTVYQNDHLEIEYGLSRNLIHKPEFDKDRGEIKGFYSVAILKDGTRAFEYMTKDEVIKHEEKYRLGKYQNNIWVKNFEEMAQKTAVKKMLKWLPISVEALEQVEADDGVYRKESEIISEVQKVEMEQLGFVEEHNNETGEVIKEKLEPKVVNEEIEEDEEFNF